jgi:Mg/Co/Ni transporter MgtE
VGVALVGVVTVGALAGSMLPFALKRPVAALILGGTLL